MRSLAFSHSLICHCLYKGNHIDGTQTISYLIYPSTNFFRFRTRKYFPPKRFWLVLNKCNIACLPYH